MGGESSPRIENYREEHNLETEERRGIGAECNYVVGGGDGESRGRNKLGTPSKDSNCSTKKVRLFKGAAVEGVLAFQKEDSLEEVAGPERGPQGGLGVLQSKDDTDKGEQGSWNIGPHTSQRDKRKEFLIDAMDTTTSEKDLEDDIEMESTDFL
ncbi:hypothetical protein U1Q18_045374 [Sarracenia purpurea var. burkii]